MADQLANDNAESDCRDQRHHCRRIAEAADHCLVQHDADDADCQNGGQDRDDQPYGTGHTDCGRQ
jgi:hypothetical protein